MAENGIGLGTAQKIHFSTPLNLRQGRVLPRYDLMVETYGVLNRNKTNAVLICHALSGDHHVAGRYQAADKDAGWWDNMVGPGKAIDTDLFFVIGLNNLGGCAGSSGPTTVNPDTGEVYGADFPLVTVEDWVATQVRLADYFGINRLAAVVGGSLGGMQALQWAITYPGRLRHAVVIAAAPKLSAQNIAFNDIARQAILSDPEFFNGAYLQHGARPGRGLKIARMMGHITYLAEQGLGQKFGRELKNDRLQYGYGIDFQVESYLRYQGDKFAAAFDGNTYLLMTKALDYFDPAQNFNNSLAAACRAITAKILLISFSSDWRFPPSRSQEILAALVREGKAVEYLAVESTFGHDAFLLTDPAYTEGMKIYFKRMAAEVNGVTD